jgi:hypothetical protein
MIFTSRWSGRLTVGRNTILTVADELEMILKEAVVA